MFVQFFTVYVHIPVQDLHRLTRQTNDPFNKIHILIAIRKNNDIITSGIRETITDLINDQIVIVMQRRIHRLSIYPRTLTDISCQQKADTKHQYDIKQHLDKSLFHTLLPQNTVYCSSVSPFGSSSVILPSFPLRKSSSRSIPVLV